jgi:hypothetical protein
VSPPSIKLSGDRVAVIAPDMNWIRITALSPVGRKCFLIRREAGVATVGQLPPPGGFFDHWYPLPTFEKETDVAKQSNAGGLDHPPVDRA